LHHNLKKRTKMDYIDLKKMRFHACHGVEKQERTVGNKFTVSLRLYLNLGYAATSDCLSDTVNYAAVFETVKREMSIPSDLLEHVAGRIIKAVKREFPEIEKIRVRVAKQNPPVDGEMAESAVVMKG